MADCDRLPTCVFFNDRMENMPTVAALLKRQYCHGDFEACARFRVAAKLGSTYVPASLFPQDTASADRIVAGT
jgi:hypothetical protein